MKSQAMLLVFFKDIYLPLLMPQNMSETFDAWIFDIEHEFVEHAKYASSVLCEEAFTMPECLYILTLCLFCGSWK